MVSMTDGRSGSAGERVTVWHWLVQPDSIGSRVEKSARATRDLATPYDYGFST
jgi:hypothetical protein